MNDTDPANWTPPRCSHGHIILACPLGDCPEQNDYIDEQLKVINMWALQGRAAARQRARAAFGLKPTP